MFSMRILLLTTLYPGYKNQSRQEVSYALHYFAKDWVNLGHEVKILRLWPEYPKVFKFLTKGKKSNQSNYSFKLDEVDVYTVKINKIPKLDYIKRDVDKSFEKIVDIIYSQKFTPDIIVTHMFNPSLFIGKKLKLKYKTPLVLTLHQTDINYLQNYRKRLTKFKKEIKYIDGLGFRSDSLKRKFEELKITEKKGFVIPSGIDEKLIINDTIKKVKQKKKSRTILIAASMIKLKNIDILIKAFENISINRDISLKIAGNGPEMKNLKKLVETLQSKEKIQFLGYLNRSEVLEHMEDADIFVMASSPETFGLVYLEAMAKGCITIGSKGEGIDGTIKHGENGYLVSPRDVNDLTKTLELALNLDMEAKSVIVENSVKTARKMTQIKMSNRYIEFLKEVGKKHKNS
jgi:L-malate glycosyltransferase